MGRSEFDPAIRERRPWNAGRVRSALLSRSRSGPSGSGSKAVRQLSAVNEGMRTFNTTGASSRSDPKRTQCPCATLVLRGVPVAAAQRCALRYLRDGATYSGIPIDHGDLIVRLVAWAMKGTDEASAD